MTRNDQHAGATDRWDDREPGDFWEGRHGYLKKKQDGTVVPAPERHCRCGTLGAATDDLPRYSCDNPDCNVISFA